MFMRVKLFNCRSEFSRSLKVLIGAVILVGALSGCAVKYSSFGSFLESHNEFKIEPAVKDPFFEQAYLLWVEQPIDHKDLSRGTFLQRVWVSHKDLELPVVLITEGYSAPANYFSELAKLLESNQIIVEHRFFGESVQGEIPWEFLTIEQAALDHQRIIRLFQQVYKGKWITTGISKGGQAAIIHRAYFPRSVDATVTYVAPFNLEREDSRLVSFFDTAGTQKQREWIRNFQVEVLKRRNELIPMFEASARERGLTFRMGVEKAFELSVLEYPFSVWQWCVPIYDQPLHNASPRELFDYLFRGIDFKYFSDQDVETFGPFFYQAYSELGYYGYDASRLIPYLKILKTNHVSSDLLIPVTGLDIEFDENVSLQILKRIKRSDPRMIHITGAKDPWSATALNVSGLKNSFRFEDPEGCHLTRIENLPASLGMQVKKMLNDWMNRN
jgi:hypothetical protein